MSDTWTGPGSWLAADGKWYPPRDLPTHEQPTRDDDTEPDEEGGIENGSGEGDRWDNRGWVADQTPIRRTRIVSGNRIVAAAAGDEPLRASIDLRRSHLDPEKEEEAAEDAAALDLTERIDLTSHDAVAPVAAASAGSGVMSADAPTSGSEPPPVPPEVVEPPAGRPRVDISSHTPTDDAADAPARAKSDEPADWPSLNTPVRESDAMLPAPIETQSRPSPPATRTRAAAALLVVATALAVAAGILGALWLGERSDNDDLRAELDSANEAAAAAPEADVDELLDQIRTLELQNEQLARQVQEMGALVPDVPRGRISEITLPITPSFVDEVLGSFIAVDATGEYVVWGGGLNDEITGSGSVAGSPIGLVAQRDLAWIVTDQGVVEVVSLIGESQGEPLTTGPIEHLIRNERAMWGFSPEANELRRYRQTNARVTAAVPIPSPARDLTVGAGAVWALGEDGLVYRVNTADFTVTPAPAGQEVVSITAGADAMWALSAADGSLRRIDAVTGDVLVTVPVGRDPVDAVVSGNSVWVALRSGTSLIEVDTRTNAVVSRTALPGEPASLSRGETGVLVIFADDTPLVRVASVEPEADADPEAVAEDQG